MCVWCVCVLGRSSSCSGVVGLIGAGCSVDMLVCLCADARVVVRLIWWLVCVCVVVCVFV